jgi:hypothetical protein
MATAEQYAQWIVDNQNLKGTEKFNIVAKAYQEAKTEEPKASVEVTSLEGQPIQPQQFAETGGGAAMGRPINRGQLNIQPEPRPLESVLAGATKSAIDPFVGASQLLTGGATSPMAQKLGQEAEVYSKANPISYGAGRVGGALLPAVAGGAVTGMLPSFAKMPSLMQNITMGTALGAVTPEETGKTGAELYKEQGKQGLIGGTIGAALTPFQKLAGVLRGPEQPAQMAEAVQKARQAGYVVPPSQARGDLANRLMEGIAGKTTTAQNASAKNQEVTHKLVAKSLGLPEEEVITPELLKTMRTEAGQAYENLGLSGTVKTSKKYMEALDNISKDARKAAKDFPEADINPVINLVDSLKTNQFDVASAVAKIKGLRNQAEIAFRKGDNDLGKAARNASEVLENTIQSHLANTKQTDLLNAFRDARQLIAKTHSIEKALNPVSGTVDSKVLAAQLKKGKPLTEELKTVAEFASQFPKASQVTEKMGSLPQISPLDYGLGGLASLLTNPAAIAGVAARPALRAAALSEPVQNRLVQGAKMTPEEINTIKLLLMQGGIPAANSLSKGKENE